MVKVLPPLSGEKEAGGRGGGHTTALRKYIKRASRNPARVQLCLHPTNLCK